MDVVTWIAAPTPTSPGRRLPAIAPQAAFRPTRSGLLLLRHNASGGGRLLSRSFLPACRHSVVAEFTYHQHAYSCCRATYCDMAAWHAVACWGEMSSCNQLAKLAS